MRHRLLTSLCCAALKGCYVLLIVRHLPTFRYIISVPFTSQAVHKGIFAILGYYAAIIVDVSARHVDPIFKSQAIREELFLDIWLLDLCRCDR